MSYSLAPHVAALPFSANTLPVSGKGTFFSYALIDRGQLNREPRKLLDARLTDMPHALLFEDTFAHAALELSPVLLALRDGVDVMRDQIHALDALCRDLPILSILHSTLDFKALLEQLRALLLIEADGTPYLLRLADTQMLGAISAILTPLQKESVFKGIYAWMSVDCYGCLNDAAQEALQRSDIEPPPLPLTLDAQQTHALLDAAIVPMLTSQLRKLDPLFSQQLDHARQSSFVTKCVHSSRVAGISDDTELLARLLDQWRARGGQHHVA